MACKWDDQGLPEVGYLFDNLFEKALENTSSPLEGKSQKHIKKIQESATKWNCSKMLELLPQEPEDLYMTLKDN